MAAEFIGLDNIIEYLSTLEFDQLKIYDKTRKDCLAIIKKLNDDENEDDLIKYLQTWFERLLKSSPVNSRMYYLQLMEKPEGAGKYRGTMSFSFALQNPPESTYTKPAASAGGISERELGLAVQNAHKDAYIERLEDRLLALEAMEDDDEDEEPENVGALGAIQTMLEPHLPDLIKMFISTMTTPKAMPAVHGIGGNIDETINEFRKINPNIESDLHKLLTIAKTKPDLFNMLINNLRSL